MPRIDLMIIGAQKAGTTSLKNYLAEHPKIASHVQTEFSFFRDDIEYSKGFEHAFNLAFSSNHEGKQIVAKGAWMSDDLKTLERLYSNNPNCLIVFIIRNPVDRAFSSFNMEKFKGWEDREFSEIIDVINQKLEDDRFFRLYLQAGRYSDHLRKVYKVFPKRNVKVIKHEDLSKSSEQVCANLFEWMGLEVCNGIDFSKRYNPTKKSKFDKLMTYVNKLQVKNNWLLKSLKRALPNALFQRRSIRFFEWNKSDQKIAPMDPRVRKYLKEFYKESIEELEKMEHISLESWKI